jgi:hypothetical protein
MKLETVLVFIMLEKSSKPFKAQRNHIEDEETTIA